MSFAAKSDDFFAAIKGLSFAFSDVCSHGVLDKHATESDREIPYLEIKPRNAPAVGRHRALLLGGMHARELAPPAAVLSFAEKLIKGYTGDDAVYPAFSDGSVPYKAWSVDSGEIQRIINELTILVVPVVNPDGRDFVLGVPPLRPNPGWRGNRNIVACPKFGVDINRNFAVGWDTATYYTKADEKEIVPLGTNPACTDDNFRGPAAGSEKETDNIQRLIDDNDVRFFMDVHSDGRRVLTPWGLADNQSKDPTQNFNNDALDRRPDGTGGRSVLDGTYKEYLPDDKPDQLLRTHGHLAQAMVQAISEQAGANKTAKFRSQYTVRQIPDLKRESLALRHILPIPGSAVDYALARQFKPGEPKPAYALAMEVGYKPLPTVPGSDPENEGGFVPLNAIKFQKIEREVHAGLFAFLKAAVGAASPTGGRGKKK